MEGAPTFTPVPEPRFAGRLMASWGYRVGAFVVDVGFAVLVGLVVGHLAKAAGADNDTATGIGGLAGIAAWIADTCVVVGLTRGQSVGKRPAGMRVVRENGRPARFGTGLVRDTLCGLVYLVPFFGLIDVFMPLGYEHQSLRDKMVRTRVLREEAYRARRWALTGAAVVLTGAWVAVTVANGTWSTTDDYQALDRDAFVSGCSHQGVAESRCGCAFDYIKARVPYSEYRQGDRTSNSDEWPAHLRRVVADAFVNC